MNLFKRLFGKPIPPLPEAENKSPFGSTGEEIAAFLAPWGDAKIKAATITIENYIFEPSIAYGHKVFHARDIKYINLQSFPPAICVEKELIFISAMLKGELELFAVNNQIPVSKVFSPWAFILDSFLDTEFSDEAKQKTNDVLAQYGLTSLEVNQIRATVEAQMLKYNFDTMLWNWTSFDTIDVLMAMRPKYTVEQFRDFYRNAMRIALLEKKTD